MRVIIAGSRDIADYNLVIEAISSSPFKITTIVSGGARGVDKLGERWAKEHDRRVKKFYADWDVYGKAAGHIRNVRMAKYADALIAVWDGKSRGTRDMIDVADLYGLKICVLRTDERKIKCQTVLLTR